MSGRGLRTFQKSHTLLPPSKVCLSVCHFSLAFHFFPLFYILRMSVCLLGEARLPAPHIRVCRLHASYLPKRMQILIIFAVFLWRNSPNSGIGCLTADVSRLHTHTHTHTHPIKLLRTGDQPVTQAATHTTDEHSYPQRDSNQQCRRQSSGRTARLS